MRSSVKPCDFHSSTASSSAGTWSSPPKTLTQILSLGIPSWSESSSDHWMASALK